MRNVELSRLKSTSTCQGLDHSNLNLPNSLTVFRILLIPVFMFVFISPSWNLSYVPALLFALAALTDLLDGYLARRNNQVTDLGRLLDPIADKLLVLSGLILLVQFQRIEAWLAIAIIAREVAVSGLRSIAAAEGMIISADSLGKAKAFLQVIGILCLTLPSSPAIIPFDTYEIGGMVLYMALAFGVISGLQYCVQAFQSLSSGASLKSPI
jgi:CDP-diacylglycerol---glycerol-3-phosphate 3-phosphatidyltransferase